MTRLYEHCRLACPYWLSTIRAVQLPPVTDADIPAEARSHLAVVVQAIQTGSLPSAAPAVELARRLVDTGTRVEVFLVVVSSMIRMNAGDLPGAERLLDEAATSHATSAALHQARGVVRLRQRNFAGAVESFNDCVQLNPEAGDAWAALAVIHSLEQDHAATEKAAREALRLSALQQGLVPLALMQATYLQGKPVEGAMDFSSLDEPGEAKVAEWLGGFPPIDVDHMAHRHGRPVYFIYADHNYVIEHAIPLLLSLNETRSDSAAHLHVANPGRGLRAILARLRNTLGDMPLVVSTETVMVEQYAPPMIYHSCMRFVRMYQLLALSDSPVVMLDADVLVRRNPVPLVEQPPTDVVVSRSPYDPLWSTYYGGYLQVNPTPAGRAYLGQVSAFILDNIRKGTARWFLDQTALAVCCDALKSKARYATLVDGATRAQDYTGEEFFWTAVNENKYGDNPHTREKRRLRATFGFEPSILEPQEHFELAGPPGRQMVVRAGDDDLAAALRSGVVWRKPEIDVLLAVLRPGSTVVEARASDGGMTVPLARHVGPCGRIFAFEPRQSAFQRLMANVVLSGVRNVFGRQRACGIELGREVSDDSDAPLAIDDLELDACHLIRLDADGDEASVLASAERTIRRHHPLLYVARAAATFPPTVSAVIRPLGYRVLINAPHGSPSGFLCLPPESRIVVNGLTPVE
jgi:hypothetical protein